MTTTLKEYPTLQGFDQPESHIVEQVKAAINQFSFFYIKDTIKARASIDQELENLQNSVDVYYGEDADTGKGSVFHGTYSRFEVAENTRIKQYYELINRLLRIISLALGYPQEFLQEFSQREKYGLYFYDREQEYMQSIQHIDPEEIAIPPHKDRSLITLVISIKGLETYMPEYGWFSAPDREGYLMVQAGTLLQDLTQQAIKANIHRVRGYDSSKALFWGNLIPVE